MRMLVLGGGRQLGGGFVEAALARGHAVTLFNRGVTNPGRYANVTTGLEIVHGDRDHDLARLPAGTWDAVFDSCAYTPSTLRRSLDALDGRAGHYVFISTVTVYAPGQPRPVHEDSRLLPLENAPSGETVSLESYGYLKVRCEQLLRERRTPCLIVRPGVMTGPEDHTARLKFWVDEVAEHDDVIVPGRPSRVLQLVDSRDVAAWALHAVEARTTGTFNCAGASQTMSTMLEQCRAVLERPEVRLHWRSVEALAASPELQAPKWPLWNDGVDDHFDSTKAGLAGFSCRPFDETIRSVRADCRRSAFVVPDTTRRAVLSCPE